MRLRSILLVPAGEPSLEAAIASDADAIAVSVADARWPVTDLRQSAARSLEAITAAGKLALAVVNHPRTRLLREDAAALVGPNLGGVILPHTVNPQDVRDLGVVLREFELEAGVEPGAVIALPAIDTARGLLRAAETAVAAPRVTGLIFDGPAYAADVNGREEEHGGRLAYARGGVVAAARATDRLPLIRANAFEMQQLGHYGFAGGVIETAAGVAAANLAFTPSEAEVAHARAQIAVYQSVRGEGGWAARLGAEVVEADTVRRARQLLAQAGHAE